MNTPIIIRSAESGDIEALKPLKEQIHNLHVEGNPKHFCRLTGSEIEVFFSELMRQKDTRIVLAQTDGNIAGYMVLIHFTRDARPGHNSRNVLIVDEICVYEKMRGMGVGKALMQGARDIACELGADSMELSVWVFNSEAIAFYEHIGMKSMITRYGLNLN